MKKYYLLIIALLWVGVVYAVHQSVAVVVPLEGNIYIGNQKIDQSTLVTKNDIIRTDKDSFAELKMNNGDIFKISHNTVISVEEYYDPDDDYQENSEKSKPSVFQILTGKIRALIESEDKEKVMVKTGNAMVGVKGTDFIVEVPSHKVTQVTTISGIVSLRRIRARDTSEEVLLKAGFRSILLYSQRPTNPIAISRRDHNQITRTFKIEDEKAIKAITTEEDAVDSFLMREIERRMVQKVLHKQAIITVDVNF